jgi:hypothetical protein
LTALEKMVGKRELAGRIDRQVGGSREDDVKTDKKKKDNRRQGHDPLGSHGHDTPLFGRAGKRGDE